MTIDRPATRSVEIERLTFLSFVNNAMACILAFAVVYFASAVWLRQWELAWVGLVLTGWLAAGFAARALALRQAIEGGALVVGYSALVGAAILAVLFSVTHASLLFVCMMASAAALPYLSGKRLRLLMLATFVVTLEVIGVTSFVPEKTALPTGLEHFLVIAGVFAGAGLMLQLLWQFSSRLKQTLEETRKSEERFRSLVVATSQVVWTADANGLHRGDSSSWLAFTGQTEQESKGWGWLDAVHPEDRRLVKERVSEAVWQNKPYTIENRLRRPDGSYTWTTVRGAPVLNEDGTVREWVAVNVDISARKSVEELQQQLIGMVGHDLRSPLSAILTSAAILKRAPDLNPKRVATASRIESSGQRMERIIQDLVDYTRARFGLGISVVPRLTNLNQLCEQVISEAEASFPARKIEYRPTGDPNVVLDPHRIEQVLLNLCTNALKYSPEGTPVRLSWSHPGNGEPLTFAVHNDGSPIPAELLPQLFEPFRRGPQSDKTAHEGLGLGLFIVREIVRAHRGVVEVHSDAGDGTTLTVHLPSPSGGGLR